MTHNKGELPTCDKCKREGTYQDGVCFVCHQEKEAYTKATVLSPAVDKGIKYMRTIRERETGKTIQVDTYDVALAFGMTCAPRVHALKKVLCPGSRGNKDESTDIDEAINSLLISKEMIVVSS
jgi:hypothetical protein